MHSRFVAVSSLVLLAGCMTFGYSYTPTTRNVAAAREPNCDFDLLSMRPDRPFRELGVIERVGPVSRGGSSFAAAFKANVGEGVCLAGGDAVVTEVNGFGQYIRGTIIEYRDQPSRPAPAPPAARLPPAPVVRGKRAASIVAESAEVRSAPFKVAPVVAVLPRGQRLAVDPTPADGWRVAVLSDGRTGYVEDAEVEVDASP